MVTLTILAENTAHVQGASAEHGLSVLVETPAGALLWDTGQTDAFRRNAALLCRSLEGVRVIALSHGHYDHTGGLPAAIAASPRARIAAHPDVFAVRWSRRPDGAVESVGMPHTRADLERAGAGFDLDTGPRELLPGVLLSGAIPRDHGFEDTGGDFFLDETAAVPDTLPDDQALAIATPGGYVALLGCAHAGVVNTLDHLASLTGARRFRAIIGGMHLLRARENRLRETAAAFERYCIELIVPCHCTGGRAVRFFRERFGVKVAACGSGARFAFV